MNPPKPKKQHWVSQFYLRQFAIPETINTKLPKVWAFRKNSGDPNIVNVKDIAERRYLYSPLDEAGYRSWATEDKLGNLESTLSRIWPVFADGFTDIYENESFRKIMALFVATLHLRNPSQISSVEKAHKHVVDTFSSLPVDEKGNPIVEAVMYEDQIKPFDPPGFMQYTARSKTELQHDFVAYINTMAVSVAEILLEKRWSIIFSEDSQFITTDKPVVVINKNKEKFGLKTEGTIIMFPISSSRLLVLDDRYNEPKGQYYPLSPEGPGPHNLLIWREALNFMISPRHTDEVCEEMLSWADIYDQNSSLDFLSR